MNIEVIYSDRRSVAIKIKDGRVIVRAPRDIKKSELEKIIIKYRDWIEKTLIKENELKRVEKELSDEEIKELKKSARAYFTEKCEHFASIMGCSYNRISITSAKTRFGSCSSKKNISFSYRLMLYPEAAREYVVVHELAHLSEMNHSKKFYQIIEKYLPDYKARRKLLKNK